MNKEALKLALKCAERCDAIDGMYSWSETITTIKAALAQPEQEPVCPACKAEVLYECVACSNNNYPPQPAQEPVGKVTKITDNGFKCEFNQRLAAGTKLYTAPPQRPWAGLTHAETKACMFEWDGKDAYVLCRAIEAKLKEKNT